MRSVAGISCVPPMKHLFKTMLTLPPLTGATVRGGLGLLALLAAALAVLSAGLSVLWFNRIL